MAIDEVFSNADFGVRLIWVYILTLPLTLLMTSHKWLHISVKQEYQYLPWEIVRIKRYKKGFSENLGQNQTCIAMGQGTKQEKTTHIAEAESSSQLAPRHPTAHDLPQQRQPTSWTKWQRLWEEQVAFTDATEGHTMRRILIA